MSLFFAAIGWKPHLSAGLAFAGGFYLLGLSNCFGYASHQAAAYVLVLATLAVLSDEHPSWIFFSIRTQLLLIYAIAGMQKIRLGNLTSLPDHMASNFIYTGKPLGLFLAQFPEFCWWLGGIALFFEVTSLLALFFPRLQKFYFGFFFIMHAVTVFLLPVNFIPVMICYVFVVPRYELPKISIPAVALLIFICGMYFHDAILLTDSWPFGDYKMYASRSLIEQIRWDVEFIDEKGQEIQSTPNMMPNQHLILVRNWIPKWIRQDPIVLQKNMAILLEYANQDKNQFKGAKLFRIRWDKVTLENFSLQKPDHRYLYYSTISTMP